MVKLLVVPLLVGGRGDPPADVDVVAQQVGRQRRASSERVQVAASEVLPAGVVDRVGERATVPELAFVPDQVDEVVVGSDRAGGPASAAGAPDYVEAGVDSADVLVEIGAADRVRANVVVTQLPRSDVAVRHRQAFHEPVIVHDIFSLSNRYRSYTATEMPARRRPCARHMPPVPPPTMIMCIGWSPLRYLIE
jgi:hypothetical protein